MIGPLAPVAALPIAERVLRRPGALVLVDGRSGSGKTTFAAALTASTGALLLRMEDLYPGWDGLRPAADLLVRRVLAARASGAPALVPGWDWATSRPGPSIAVPPGALVVEGCGALSRRSSALADLRVLVELRGPERRDRALERDGDVFAPHWDRWARQEAAFLAAQDPRGLADLVVDGRRFPQAVFSGRSARAHYPRRP